MFEGDLDRLERVSRTLFGKDWRRPLAKALAPYRPDLHRRGQPLPESSLYAWLDGGRAIPAWVMDALPHLARDRAAELWTAGRLARALSLELAGLSEADLQAARRELATAEV